MTFNFKQCIVVRSDLGMSIGKTSVQVAHAAVASAFETRETNPSWYLDWFDEGQKKVVLSVQTLEDLLQTEKEAGALGICTALIEDKGLTELPPGTVTALGIGPAPSDVMDKVTSNLPLLR